MIHPLDRVCPICGADTGHPCTGKRGQHRKSFHRSRGRRPRARPIYVCDSLRTESPIEEMLAGAITEWIDHHGVRATLATQIPIGPYRADILIEADGRKLVVECDGAAYHTSPDQIAHDKRRDRYCVANGLAVMRFSGDEIKRDPRGCAVQVGKWITLR